MLSFRKEEDNSLIWIQFEQLYNLLCNELHYNCLPSEKEELKKKYENYLLQEQENNFNIAIGGFIFESPQIKSVNDGIKVFLTNEILKYKEQK